MGEYNDPEHKKENANYGTQLAVLATDVGYIKTAVTRIEALVKQELSELSKEIPNLIKDVSTGKITEEIKIQFQAMKNLLSQSINIANDVSMKLNKNLSELEESKKNIAFQEKLLLTIVPTDKLKEIIEDNG